MAAAFVEKDANISAKTRVNFRTCFSRQWKTLVLKLQKQRNEKEEKLARKETKMKRQNLILKRSTFFTEWRLIIQFRTFES